MLPQGPVLRPRYCALKREFHEPFILKEMLIQLPRRRLEKYQHGRYRGTNKSITKMLSQKGQVVIYHKVTDGCIYHILH